MEDAKIEKKKEEKRKSGLSFLTNISELDREAQEIIRKRENEKSEPSNISELPEFMRPKECKTNTDSWVPPKRKTAKDLIAKFNAITNVSKVTVLELLKKMLNFLESRSVSMKRKESRCHYLNLIRRGSKKSIRGIHHS